MIIWCEVEPTDGLLIVVIGLFFMKEIAEDSTNNSMPKIPKTPNTEQKYVV